MASVGARLRRALAGRTAAPAATLDEEDVLDFLYPYTQGDPAERERIRSFVRQCNPIRSLADLRPFLARAEQQTAPSPVVLRFGPDDLATYTLEGLTLFALRDDPAVSEEILRGDVYEPHVDATLRRLCRPGDVVVDVGANIGVHTFLMSSLVGEGGSVLALEPNSENCRLIILGMLENGISNITLWPIALSTSVGWSYYATHYGSNGGFIADDRTAIASGRGVVVPVFPLDDLPVTRPVTLVKVDVEGAEGLVLGGAAKLLKEDRPIVLTELSSEMLERVSGMGIQEYLGVFFGLGYSAFVIERPAGRWAPTSLEELVSLRETDPFRIDDLLLVPPGSGRVGDGTGAAPLP